jgi:putative membrane protein
MRDEAVRDLPPDRGLLAWILLLSAGICAFLFWWVYLKGPAVGESPWIGRLPAVNATLNSLCALCLVAGYWNIRRGRRQAHQRFMLSALGFSALFLVSYLTYHHFHGDTPFPGEGWVRPVYFAILISHIVLSMVVLPMILGTVIYAFRGRFDVHRRIARYTLPVWLYVSVTGVVVFFFLKAYT